MTESLRATVMADVYYKDMKGRLRTVKAGTLVTVSQRVSECLPSIDMLGNLVPEKLLSWIAYNGNIYFDIERMQFQVLS